MGISPSSVGYHCLSREIFQMLPSCLHCGDLAKFFKLIYYPGLVSKLIFMVVCMTVSCVGIQEKARMWHYFPKKLVAGVGRN